MHARLELLAFAIKSVLDDDSDISVLYDIVDRTEDDLLLFLQGVDAVMDKNEAVSQDKREAKLKKRKKNRKRVKEIHTNTQRCAAQR